MVNGEYGSSLRRADDLALLSTSGYELQIMITAVNKQCRIEALKLACRKVVYSGAQIFDIKGEAVDVVIECIYLVQLRIPIVRPR